MVKTKNFIPIVLLGALPAMMLLLHGYIGSFTRYIADDYCSAYWAERFGLLRSVWHWYITWSGRFSAYASDWFIMLIGARNVRFIPPIVLILWLAITTFALYLYVRRILSKENAFGLSLLLSVVFIFSMLLLSPNIQQSFFWWNGMRSYNLPLIFLTLFALVFQLASEKLTTVKSIVLGSLFTLVFFFLNAGLSDTFAVAQFTLLGILIFLWLINPEHRKADLAIPSAGLLGTALAIIVIILSPGNAAREVFFPPHPAPLSLAAIAAQGYMVLVQSMAGAPEKVFGLIASILVAMWAGTKTDDSFKPKAWTVVAFVALGFLLSFVSFLPASYGTSEAPPTRTMMVAVFALVVNFMIAGFIAGRSLSLAINTNRVSFALLALAVITINISAAMDIQKAYQSKDIYITYAKNWDAVETQILSAKASGQASVTVPSLRNWADLDVLSDNPKNWLNTCTTGFYGIQVIGKNQ